MAVQEGNDAFFNKVGSRSVFKNSVLKKVTYHIFAIIGRTDFWQDQ